MDHEISCIDNIYKYFPLRPESGPHPPICNAVAGTYRWGCGYMYPGSARPFAIMQEQMGPKLVSIILNSGVD